MKQLKLTFFAIFCLFTFNAAAQIPTATSVQIIRAEDERRYDKTLENLLTDSSEAIRRRAALAAGRIGDERAVPALASLLEKDTEAVRAVAAFALGEIESAKGADAILKTIENEKAPVAVRARAVEAAGKIAAAIAQTDKAKYEDLGRTILDAVETENDLSKPDRRFLLLGLTAILRARPTAGDFVAGKFLTNLDARVRADAANTLARLRSKNFNSQLRTMLLSDDDAVARATAARALGAAEDKDSFNVLLETALTDDDERVRVSAIRAVGSLRDRRAAVRLVERGEKLLGDYRKSKAPTPAEKNELLEIAAALGRILPGAADEKALAFLQSLREADRFRSPETEIAFASVAPAKYVAEFKAKNTGYADWRVASAYAQGLSALANLPNEETKLNAARTLTAYVGSMGAGVKTNYQAEMTKALPDLIRGISAFKPDNLDEILRNMFDNPDVFVRAAAAEQLGERPVTKENVETLKKAYNFAVLRDKFYNDAQLAILDALYKLDKKESVGILLFALDAPDYLVRQKAIALLRDKDLQKDFPGIPVSLEAAAAKNKTRVLPYAVYTGTRLGQVLNTNADYARAAARKNGTARAVLTTEKGAFTIELTPEDAPLTVDNFIKLARAGYFNGVAVHRVVPNFVMQDGDPRGDGNGGPGWSIRCEINQLEYERGAVGMALSGKDTGGSQWFVTHSPQPHLDGGYTVFGQVKETDMKIVDDLARGDKILSVRIIESKAAAPAKTVRQKSKAK